MKLTNIDDCRDYVSRELSQLAAAGSAWHIKPPPILFGPELSWKIEFGDAASSSWYTLEARLDEREFLIWFGNYQVGVMGLHWIMRPAVHVAFADLAPKDDIPMLQYSLSDVLRTMIQSFESQGRFQGTHFPPNTFSIT